MSYAPDQCYAVGFTCPNPTVGNFHYCADHLQAYKKPGYQAGALHSVDTMSEQRFLKPDHYAYSDHEPDDVIEAWGLEYRLGQVLRYLCRCDRKKNKLKDLKKAQWYLNREIEKLEKTA